MRERYEFVDTTPVAAGPATLRRDEQQHDTTRHDEIDETMEKRTLGLEEENLQLKIETSAKAQVINHTVAERKDFVTQLIEQSNHIGTLRAKLLALTTPEDRYPTQSDHTLVDQEGDNLSAED